MTLEEAIEHCKEKACGNTQCSLEHRQLAEWLQELQQYRKYNTEYVRKDAFTEKACEWLINHNDYICGSTNGIVKYDMKQLVENFKKYMEEE